MTTELLKSLLVKAVVDLGWQVDQVEDFTSPTFRSRSIEPDARPIEGLFGLRIGDYPVIVAPIALDSVEGVKASLKKLHAQMIIARSFMYEREVINSHLFLCAASPTPTGEWQRLVHLVERDETVCRKIVWIPKETAMQESFDGFLTRTFMAIPWAHVEAVSGVPLDQTHGLAERILEKHGLEKKVAQRWITLTAKLMDDAESLVIELVQAKEES